MSVAKINFVEAVGGKSVLMKEFTGYLPKIGESMAIVRKEVGQAEEVTYFRVLDIIHYIHDNKSMTSDICAVIERLSAYVMPKPQVPGIVNSNLEG